MTDQDARTNIGASFHSSAAMVRAESDHVNATLSALAKRLSSVPGLRMSVSYQRGKLRRLIGDLPYINDLGRGTDRIRKIVVELGSCSYWLESDCGSIKCGREFGSVEVGQVNGELSFAAWATALFDEIARQNFVNHESMVALRHLVEQDRVE